MDPVSIGLMGTKFLGGAVQALAGRRILRKTKLPEYDIAPEFEQNVGLAQDIKNMGGMPAEQYMNAMNNIFRSANFGVNQLQKRNAAIAGVGNIAQRAMDATRRVDEFDANMAIQNRRMGTQMQIQANTAMAGQKLAKQQWEKFNPFLRRLNEGQSLLGAGLQNMFGSATGLAQMDMYRKYLDKDNQMPTGTR